MKLKNIIVESTTGYKGENFDLNYNATKLVKFLSEQITSNGFSEEENRIIFESYFGHEISPLLDLCYQNKECLNEIAEINEPLLFEEDLHEGLGEILAVSKGFLKQAWDIVKNFGLNIWDKLSGIPWLKDLVSSAAASPTFNVVCSGLTVFFALGSLYKIFKMINKIRRTKKQAALTRQEREEYKRILVSNKDEIEKELRKRGVKEFKINAPKGTDTKDEDIKFTSKIA